MEDAPHIGHDGVQCPRIVRRRCVSPYTPGVSHTYERIDDAMRAGCTDTEYKCIVTLCEMPRSSVVVSRRRPATARIENDYGLVIVDSGGWRRIEGVWRGMELYDFEKHHSHRQLYHGSIRGLLIQRRAT